MVINQVLNKVEEKHKTSVNNVSEESKVSPVTDLKHLLVLWFYDKINEGKIENSVTR